MPSGTSSGWRVTAAMRSPASSAGAASSRSRLRDVALVACAPPAERVGVDDDERAHAAARSYAAIAASAARSQV